MKFLIIFSFLFLCLSSNCKKEGILTDDELSIPKKEFSGNQLRIDGYYYQKYGNPERLMIYFMYRNGILLYGGGGYEMGKINEFEQEIQTQQAINKIRGLKFCWGVFDINSINIKFERWYPSEGTLPSYVRSGTILNDTTFVISESYRFQNGEKTDAQTENETYHFKKFSPKPDSTNKFIK